MQKGFLFLVGLPLVLLGPASSSASTRTAAECSDGDNCGKVVIHYSDASMTQAVGWFGNMPLECDCEPVAIGTITSYRQDTYPECPTP